MSTDIQRDELLKVVYTTPILKDQIDEYLEDGWKINAIKELKLYCETTSYPAWLKDVSHKLRLMKDVIDKYDVRRTIYEKLNKLHTRIEIYCNKHGYDKMGNYKEVVDFDWESASLETNGQPMLQFNKEYWLPSKDGESPEIETLSSEGPELSDTEALKYFADKI